MKNQAVIWYSMDLVKAVCWGTVLPTRATSSNCALRFQDKKMMTQGMLASRLNTTDPSAWIYCDVENVVAPDFQGGTQHGVDGAPKNGFPQTAIYARTC